MYSWVCASTPVVTRTITAAARPRWPARRSRSISSKESTMIRPTPARAPARARRRSCCCRAARSARIDPGPQGHRELAAGADVDAETLLGDPAGHGRTEEGLGGVVDVPAGEGRPRTPVRARAGRSRPPRTPACRPARRSRDVQSGDRAARPASSLSTPRAPQPRHQRVDVGRQPQPARGAAHDVRVDRAGDMGVGHLAHPLRSGSTRTEGSPPWTGGGSRAGHPVRRPGGPGPAPRSGHRS